MGECDDVVGSYRAIGHAQGEDVHTSIFRPVGPPVDSSEWRLLWGVDELQGGLRERCVLLHPVTIALRCARDRLNCLLIEGRTTFSVVLALGPCSS